jgi:phage terminase Nu1 subunit (DNA packaging protein)
MPELQDALTVSRVLGITERQVYNLARDGKIPRASRGRYDVLACVRSYLSHLREVAAGRSSGGDGVADLVGERARLAREQADAQAMKNAQRRGELASVFELEQLLVSVHSVIQRRLLACPTALAPLVAVENDARVCERIIREEIVSALQSIADTRVKITLAPQGDAPGTRESGRRDSVRVSSAARPDG